MEAFQHLVLNFDNVQVDTVDLMVEVFKLKTINKHLIWEAVRYHLAKRRAGNASTKSRWEISGSGRKLWKQKGTGRARIGSIRSALWRGGSTVHGPKPRSYDYMFPKRARRTALRNALSSKLAAGQLLVVENWSITSHKTQDLIKTLAKIGVNSSALLIGTEVSKNVIMAAGNNPKLATIESLGVNVYDLLHYDQVIFSKEAILALQEVVKL